jgi:hypothetical protein
MTNNSTTSSTYNLEIFREYLNLNDFRFKFFVPNTGKIAVANDDYLVITDGIVIDENDKRSGKKREKNDIKREKKYDDINTVIEFNEVSGKPTTITWVTERVICVGYDTGVTACFDIDGNTLFEKKFTQG